MKEMVIVFIQRGVNNIYIYIYVIDPQVLVDDADIHLSEKDKSPQEEEVVRILSDLEQCILNLYKLIVEIYIFMIHSSGDKRIQRTEE